MHRLTFLSGDGLRHRALRGTAVTLGGVGGQQFLRLASNLILTRLMFPEAFGLMALIQTFMVGLQMFSDIGIGPSIIQNRRGEDPDFLNTAWTIQIIRGTILWLLSCALAWPLARFYDEPQIFWLMPVVGLSALITGFRSTKNAVANRNMQLGLQTAIALASQAAGLVVMIVLAWMTSSVWSLVIGGLVSGFLSVWAERRFLPGMTNAFRWERGAARDLIGFGKFIFISSLAGFFVNQGEKIVLGKLVSLADLGIYNIGFFMASFPAMLGSMIAGRILFPLYREIRPSESLPNRRKIRRARNLLTGSMIALFGTLAISGNFLIGFLYDPRYAAAGPMLIIMAIMQIPAALTMGNAQLLLAEGDSRRFSHLTLIQAGLNFILLFGGFWLIGMAGVLLIRGLSIIGIYPLQQIYLSRYHGTDLRRDAVFLLIGALFSAIAIWVNWDVLAEFGRVSVSLAPAVTGNWYPKNLFGG
ncbi:MAG: oligosaccharide flippase family protein [Paracoccus sp.]|nr:oligosaccharide flippase family protein [Paracoccus sp. (in: a-proteobacteria)]